MDNQLNLIEPPKQAKPQSEFVHVDRLVSKPEPEITLLHGDCLKLMFDLPDNSVDMVCCDMPYGTTACKWDTVLPLDMLWHHYKRIVKDNGAIVLFSAQPFTSTLVATEPKLFKYSWFWRKNRATSVLNAKRQPLRDVEEICVFNAKGYNPQGLVEVSQPSRNSKKDYDNYGNGTCKSYTQKYTNYPRQVLEFKSVQRTIHPTQKPVELIEYLIKTYTNEGDTVLDNCMGSGTTGVACKNLNRNFVGIELDDKYFDIATKRIEEC
ncbi:MAG: site-specific DNA-methyltransferase [Lentisphaerae bacterium]|nr:site-specific DNA-methyltransferase [Lentisphaerota bacterium]